MGEAQHHQVLATQPLSSHIITRRVPLTLATTTQATIMATCRLQRGHHRGQAWSHPTALLATAVGKYLGQA
jgi:hypothetical protein